MNIDIQEKSTIAIVIAIVALGFSLFNYFQEPTQSKPYTVESFFKETALELGVKEKDYKQCLVSDNNSEKILSEIRETEFIAQFANLTGIGTPFNLIITDTQVIPVNGAYPYDVFDFIINEIKSKGTVSKEALAQFEITEVDYAVTDGIRSFDSSIDHYRGGENPTITLIEYSDFECPFCARVHETLNTLVGNHSELTWVYRHLPLSFHDQAMPAALVSECIADEAGNDAFWVFADTIFKDQKKLQI